MREKLIDPETHNNMLQDWVKLDSKMRHAGKELRKWPGTLPLIGSEVSAFDTICTVCDYGVQESDGEFERCLWIKSGGDLVKAISNEVSAVTDEKREAQNAEFKGKLIAAGKKVERQRKERRARTVKGSHLVDAMIDATKEFTVDKKSSFYKITGTQKGRAVYVLIKGGRVDLSGFNIDDIAVVKITEEEAKKRHLGRVRGQLNFAHPDSVVMESFRTILKELL